MRCLSKHTTRPGHGRINGLTPSEMFLQRLIKFEEQELANRLPVICPKFHSTIQQLICGNYLMYTLY